MKIGNVALLGIFLLSVGSGCASAGSRKPAQANASDPTSVSPPVTPTILGGNIQSFDFKDGNQAIAFRVYAPNKAGEPYTMTLEGYGKKIVAVSSQDYPTDDVFGGWDSKKLAQKMPIILPPHGGYG
jgi:hypothetical protein